jgi:hypothetical protein
MLLALASEVLTGSESLGTRDHILLSESESESESESYVTTDDQLAGLSWYKAAIRGLRPDFFFPFGIRNTSDSYVLHSVGHPL